MILSAGKKMQNFLMGLDRMSVMRFNMKLISHNIRFMYKANGLRPSNGKRSNG